MKMYKLIILLFWMIKKLIILDKKNCLSCLKEHSHCKMLLTLTEHSLVGYPPLFSTQKNMILFVYLILVKSTMHLSVNMKLIRLISFGCNKNFYTKSKQKKIKIYFQMQYLNVTNKIYCISLCGKEFGHFLIC